MRSLLALLSLPALAAGAQIIGYDGQEVNRPFKKEHKVKQTKIKQHLRTKMVNHGVVNVVNKSATSSLPEQALQKVTALQTMDKIASMNVEQNEVLSEIVKLASTLVKKGDEAAAKQQIGFIEQTLDEYEVQFNSEGAGKPSIRDRIKAMRADLCENRGPGSTNRCDKFMKDFCSPGKDGFMDGDKGEGKDESCEGFYKEIEEAHKKHLEEKKIAEELKAKEAKANANVYKPNDGAVSVPSQGFEGRNVAHEDGETVTGDWGKEFGPKMQDTHESICQKYPGSDWCKKNGYHVKWAPADANGDGKKNGLDTTILIGLGCVVLAGVLGLWYFTKKV